MIKDRQLVLAHVPEIFSTFPTNIMLRKFLICEANYRFHCHPTQTTAYVDSFSTHAKPTRIAMPPNTLNINSIIRVQGYAQSMRVHKSNILLDIEQIKMHRYAINEECK